LYTGAILAVIALIPIFFFPSGSFPVQLTKTLLISCAAIILFIAQLLGALKKGRSVFPPMAVFITGGILLAVTFISSLTSGQILKSLVGEGFEVGTFTSLAVLVFLFFVASSLFTSKIKVLYAYSAFLVAFFIAALFQLIHLLVGPAFLSFSLFLDPISNLIGKWNEFGIFMAVGLFLSLFTLEFVQVSRFFKTVLYTAFAVSLFFLAIINFKLLWIVVAVFALILILYGMFFRQDGDAKSSAPAFPLFGKKISLLPLVVILIAILGFFFSVQISVFVSTHFNINSIDAWPNTATTYEIAKKTFGEHLLLGSGPNTFVDQWLLYKPAIINNTPFWNTDFSFGVGLIPTYITTTGILGLLAWILFLGFYLYVGFRSLLGTFTSLWSRYVTVSSFLVSLLLWVFMILYSPGIVISSLTFIFTGLFFASVQGDKIGKVRTVSFTGNPKKSFIFVLILIVFIVGALTSAYALLKSFTGEILFQKGVAMAQAGNLPVAREYALRAVEKQKSDLFHRFIVDIDLANLNQILNTTDKSVSEEALRSAFQATLAEAIEHAKTATTINPAGYQNWIYVGRVYEAVVPLKIAGAYEGAQQNYLEAVKRNPTNPALALVFARLELTKGDKAEAKKYVLKAIEQKNNYTEAIFLLSQLQADEGKLKDAIASVEAAATFSPNDAGLFFQLGILKFNTKDYKGAAAALERAVGLVPTYANAQYFLGLSYEKLGRDPEAIAQFTALKATNPDSQEVDLILKNLKAGRSPFSGATAPVDDKPEKRSTLPVSEKTSE
jgi:tetratricopeptide (TPR) repeat protein